MNFWETERFLAKYMDEAFLSLSHIYLIYRSSFQFLLVRVSHFSRYYVVKTLITLRVSIRFQYAFERSLKIEQANAPLVMNFVREGSSISRNNLTIGSIIVRKGSADYKPFAKAVERCTMESRR